MNFRFSGACQTLARHFFVLGQIFTPCLAKPNYGTAPHFNRRVRVVVRNVLWFVSQEVATGRLADSEVFKSGAKPVA